MLVTQPPHPIWATTSPEQNGARPPHPSTRVNKEDTLISDQGSAYINKEFQDYAKDRNIKQNLVAKGNHKANGLAENLIKQVHEAINKLAKGDFSHWPKLLPIVEFNLRTAPHAATDITPAMALYGRELKKGILELPGTTETALDERDHREK